MGPIPIGLGAAVDLFCAANAAENSSPRTDAPGPIAFLIAIFDDAATYRANAESPVQHAWYLRLREQLEADPDWMDSTFTPA